MWKLWHKLFGWDYVITYSNSRGYSRISKVETAPNSTSYAKDWLGEIKEISKHPKLTFLTCKREKYLK